MKNFVFTLLLFLVLFVTLLDCKKKKKESMKTWPERKEPDRVLNTTYCKQDDENCIEYEYPTLQTNLNENDRLSEKKKMKHLNDFIQNELDSTAMGGHQYYVDFDEDQELALYSKTDIKKNEKIFELQYNQYLHAGSASPSYFKESDRIYWHMQIPKLQYVNPDDMLAISLLYHSVWVLDSKFSDWLYTLPVEMTSPIVTLSQDELELLGYNENPQIKRYIDNFRHNVSVQLLFEFNLNKNSYYDVAQRLQDQWMNVIELMFKEFFRRQTLSFSDYTWAKYLIHSRGTYFNNRENVILVPLLDLIKYKEVKSIDSYREQAEQQELDSYITYEGAVFVLKADQDIPAGQKIIHNFKLQGYYYIYFNSFILSATSLKNYEFLLSYGYIPKTNENECVNIELAPTNMQMEKCKEYRQILFDISLIGNVCLNPWVQIPNRIFLHHMLNNIDDESIKVSKLSQYNLEKVLYNKYKEKILFHDSIKAKTFGIIQFLPPGISITYDFRIKAYEQLDQKKSKAQEKLLQIEEYQRVKHNSTETKNIKMLKKYQFAQTIINFQIIHSQNEIDLIHQSRNLLETNIDKNYQQYLKNSENQEKQEL